MIGEFENGQAYATGDDAEVLLKLVNYVASLAQRLIELEERVKALEAERDR